MNCISIKMGREKKIRRCPLPRQRKKPRRGKPWGPRTGKQGEPGVG